MPKQRAYKVYLHLLGGPLDGTVIRLRDTRMQRDRYAVDCAESVRRLVYRTKGNSIARRRGALKQVHNVCQFSGYQARGS